MAPYALEHKLCTANETFDETSEAQQLGGKLELILPRARGAATIKLAMILTHVDFAALQCIVSVFVFFVPMRVQ